jgi:hypothetical protein
MADDENSKSPDAGPLTEAAREPMRPGTRKPRSRLMSGAFVQAGRYQMIRKLQSGQYRLYSRKTDPKTGKRRNLGTFKSRASAEKHERAVQYFKRH